MRRGARAPPAAQSKEARAAVALWKEEDGRACWRAVGRCRGARGEELTRGREPPGSGTWRRRSCAGGCGSPDSEPAAALRLAGGRGASSAPQAAPAAERAGDERRGDRRGPRGAEGEGGRQDGGAPGPGPGPPHGAPAATLPCPVPVPPTTLAGSPAAPHAPPVCPHLPEGGLPAAADLPRLLGEAWEGEGRREAPAGQHEPPAGGKADPVPPGAHLGSRCAPPARRGPAARRAAGHRR